MNAFNLFDEVELVGNENLVDFMGDGEVEEIPVGTQGAIVECFPDVEGYLVEFWSRNDDVLGVAGVDASALRLVKPYMPEKATRSLFDGK